MYKLIKFDNLKECVYIQTFLFKKGYDWIIDRSRIRETNTGYIVINDITNTILFYKDVKTFKLINRNKYTLTTVKQIGRIEKLKRINDTER